MALLDLSEAERDTVGECLRAAAEGPFFPDWEFHTLFGIERSLLSAILARWPDVDDAEDDVGLAINNSMNNLLGYPHGREDEWSDYISASWAEVKAIFKKWRGQ